MICFAFHFFQASQSKSKNSFQRKRHAATPDSPSFCPVASVISDLILYFTPNNAKHVLLHE